MYTMMFCTMSFLGGSSCDGIEIFSELDQDACPLFFNVLKANEDHPAIINCSVRLHHNSTNYHNPSLKLSLSEAIFLSKSYAFPETKDLYDIVYSNTTSHNSIYDLQFEYSLRMGSQSANNTIAVCGIRYSNHDNEDMVCWSNTYTLIRYDCGEKECQCTSESTTTTAAPTTPALPTCSTPIIVANPSPINHGLIAGISNGMAIAMVIAAIELIIIVVLLRRRRNQVQIHTNAAPDT